MDFRERTMAVSTISGNSVEPLGPVDELLGARYGGTARVPTDHWNPVLSQLLSHRSVRAYLPDALPEGTVERIVAAAQSAATSSNLQTWSVVAIADPERKARLSEVAASQRHVRECPLLLVWLADLARLDGVAARQGTVLEGADYLESFIVAVVDAALAAQNAMVALESMGLGAVYIGALRNHPERVAAELGLPPHVMPVFGMCVGYPDTARPASVKPRLPQAAVLHRERYSSAAQPAPIGEYDERLRAFQRKEGMKPVGWTDQAVARLLTPASLMGRDRMREALRNLGFELK